MVLNDFPISGTAMTLAVEIDIAFQEPANGQRFGFAGSFQSLSTSDSCPLRGMIVSPQSREVAVDQALNREAVPHRS